MVIVSNALPLCFKAIGLWTGLIVVTCGLLAFFWHSYRSAAKRRRGISSVEAIDLIVLSLAGIAIFGPVVLGAILAQL